MRIHTLIGAAVWLPVVRVFRWHDGLMSWWCGLLVPVAGLGFWLLFTVTRLDFWLFFIGKWFFSLVFNINFVRIFLWVDLLRKWVRWDSTWKKKIRGKSWVNEIEGKRKYKFAPAWAPSFKNIFYPPFSWILHGSLKKNSFLKALQPFLRF